MGIGKSYPAARDGVGKGGGVLGVDPARAASAPVELARPRAGAHPVLRSGAVSNSAA